MTEGDPLLPQSKGNGGTNGIGKKLRARARTFDIVVIVILPWLIFTLMECLFTFAYWDYQGLVWALCITCITLSISFVIVGLMGRNGVQLALGLLCLAAICIAMTVGLISGQDFMDQYYRLSSGQFYNNMRPDDLGSSYQDATVIQFAVNSKVNVAQTLGYMKDGTVYCVAPVVGREASAKPSFWAVGKDCCDERANFHCDKATDPNARQAIVVSNPDDGLTTAIRMARKTYDLDPKAAGVDDVLVRWKSDALAYTNGLLESAWIVMAIASAVYLCASFGAGFLLKKALKV